MKFFLKFFEIGDLKLNMMLGRKVGPLGGGMAIFSLSIFLCIFSLPIFLSKKKDKATLRIVFGSLTSHCHTLWTRFKSLGHNLSVENGSGSPGRGGGQKIPYWFLVCFFLLKKIGREKIHKKIGREKNTQENRKEFFPILPP